MNPESSQFDIDFARKLIAFNFWENQARMGYEPSHL